MKHLISLAALSLLAACSEGGSSESSGTAPTAALAQTKTASTAERGRRMFSECAVCHTVREDKQNRVGPNLYAIVGRQAGTVDDFAYSKAFEEADFVWDTASLDSFIENPQGFLKGNRMAYVGQRNAEKRAEIIAYLKTLAPAAAEGAIEDTN